MFTQNGTWQPDNNLSASPAATQSAPSQMMGSGMAPQKPNYQAAPGIVNGMSPAQPAPAAAPQNITSGIGSAWQPPAAASAPGQMPQQPWQQMPAPQPPSLQQSVNSGPQSVQNFLGSLNQSGGQMNGGFSGYVAGNGQQAASMPGSFQNIPGQFGAGPQSQGGFQGFQQNGGHMPASAMPQWQGYGGQMNNQLGYQNNQAQSGGPVSYQQNQMGGQGGTANQAQFQATSDINSKQNIAPAEEELQDFLNHLGAYSYEYKDSKYGEGRRISPMAQEIEQSILGKDAIQTNAEGYKIVNYGKLMGTQLAATAMLNHKYQELEEKLMSAISNGLKNKGKTNGTRRS
jgi:hypothetical protein